MIHLDIRRAGTGPKQAAMWLDGEPCIVKGFYEWPKVGDRLVRAHAGARNRPSTTF